MNNTVIIDNINDFLNNGSINLFNSSNKEIDFFMKLIEIDASNSLFDELKVNDSEKAFTIHLLDNLSYYIKEFDMSGEESVMRIFLVEKDNKLRYFTSQGTVNFFGRPIEYNQEDFLYLLQNKENLKDSSYAKYMTALILDNRLTQQLNESLATNCTNHKNKL